jgi:hypothetical protein
MAALFWLVAVGKRLRRIAARAAFATVGQWCSRSAGPGAGSRSFSWPAWLRYPGMPGTRPRTASPRRIRMPATQRADSTRVFA